MSDPWDVVVVGAGIGGLALATQLGRRGYRVVLVDRELPAPDARAARFRVGESLDWEAPIYLRRLGISVEALVAEGKATFKRGAIATAATQPGVEAAFGFSPLFRFLMGLVGRAKPTIHANRERLDLDLLNSARAAGVTLVAGRARAIEREGDRVMGIVLEDSRRNHFHTRYTPRTLFGLRLLKRFHHGIDRFVPVYDAYLTGRALRKARAHKPFECGTPPEDEAKCRA